ncbi:MAG: F0F1 ATP synthase subunit B [Lachnospiraceae bacterium]|nr:F0F1 ATP synthase subunit B [Lachnospiraceae bacterium]
MEPRLFNLDFQLLSDAVLMLIAVLVLFFLLSYLFFNPARAFLQKRQEKIKAELDDAKENQDQAYALKQDYEQRLRDINKEAEAILSEARKKAMDNEAAIIAQAKEEAARIIARANTEAELEKKKIADDVKKEMISVACAVAEKAIGTSMDASIQDRLVDETLKEIGDSTWR